LDRCGEPSKLKQIPRLQEDKGKNVVF
jgi:hypothetical protein